MNTLQATLEAILFAAGDAVSVNKLAQAAEVSRQEVENALSALADRYDYGAHGIMLVRMGDNIQLCSRPAFANAIRRVTESRKPPELSPAALEVLTIIAYRQPATRALIEQLRGVDSSGTISGLAEKGLVAEAGRLDVPGRPMLFRTTDVFLRSFSLSSLSELPALPELTQSEEHAESISAGQMG